MTEIKVVFRFGISNSVFPAIGQLIRSEKQLNIISSDTFRNEFLKSKTEVADKITFFLSEGKPIPSEDWCQLWTAMIVKDALNVFTALVGNMEQFKAFEKCMESNNCLIIEIIYLKIFDDLKMIEIAKAKHSKIQDHTELLQKRIEEYGEMKDGIIEYARGKYNVIIHDFFTDEINI